MTWLIEDLVDGTTFEFLWEHIIGYTTSRGKHGIYVRLTTGETITVNCGPKATDDFIRLWRQQISRKGKS